MFEAVVEKAMRLCEATNGFLFTYDGDRFHPAAIHGDPRLIEWHRQLGPFRPAANTGLERIRRGERLVHIPDVREVDVFRTVLEPRQAVEIAGSRSALTVALRRDEVLLGALGVYRREVRPFSDKQIGLLQNFAAQAAIAMENARLIGELHERTNQVAELNRGLEARVAEQVEELGRVGRLKRFLAPQLAELIVSQGASPEGKPRAVGIVAIASSGPSSDTLYTPLQPAMSWCRQLKQFNHKIKQENRFRGTAAFRSKIGRMSCWTFWSGSRS